MKNCSACQYYRWPVAIVFALSLVVAANIYLAKKAIEGSESYSSVKVEGE